MMGACDWTPSAVNLLCLRAKVKIWEITQTGNTVGQWQASGNWLAAAAWVLSGASRRLPDPGRGVPFASGSCNKPKRQPIFAHRLWNITTSSAFKSDRSSFLPFSMTSGCLRTSSQPMWEKKKPRLALWGSASVSENLWWTRWSLAHSNMSFWLRGDGRGGE